MAANPAAVGRATSSTNPAAINRPRTSARTGRPCANASVGRGLPGSVHRDQLLVPAVAGDQSAGPVIDRGDLHEPVVAD